MFVDPNFPPTNASLWGVKGIRRCFERLEWLRPDQLTSSGTVLFEGSLAEPKPCGMRNVTQGILSDCYLVAAIALCARQPRLLSQLFVAYKPEEGWCTVRLFLNGSWEEITIDTLLPCFQGQPAFAHHFVGEPRELYACFIEKACAKAYGSYASLIGGHIDEALMDLTALPVEELNLLRAPDYSSRVAQHWEEGSLLACSWASRGADLPLHQHIRTNHSYVISDVVQETGSELKLEILDPACSECQKHTFWVESKDFLCFFNRLSICHTTFGCVFDAQGLRKTSFSLQITHENAGGCSNFPSFHTNSMFRVSATHPVPLAITVSQPDARRVCHEFGCQSMYPQLGLTFLIQENVVNQVDTDLNCCTRNRRRILVQTPFCSKRDVSVIVCVEELSPMGCSEYRVVPSLFFPGDLGTGHLQVHFAWLDSDSILVEELRPNIATDFSFVGSFGTFYSKPFEQSSPSLGHLGSVLRLRFDQLTSVKILAASVPVPLTVILTRNPEEAVWWKQDSVHRSLHRMVQPIADKEEYLSLQELKPLFASFLAACNVDDSRKDVLLARCDPTNSGRISFGQFLSILNQAGVSRNDMHRISGCASNSQVKGSSTFVGVAPLSHPERDFEVIENHDHDHRDLNLPTLHSSLASGCDQVPVMSDVTVWSASFLIRQSEFYLCPLIRGVDQTCSGFELQILSPLAGLVVLRESAKRVVCAESINSL